MKRLIAFFTLIALVTLSACGNSDTDSQEKVDKLVFGDGGWNSIRVHNSIAQKIIEEGYGIDTDVTSGSTAATIQGLREGDIDIYMEVWTDNIKKLYNESIDSGDIKEISVNFDDNQQGLYVPSYVIKGDKKRGIKPLAPDLKTVEDLKKYPELFADPSEPDKGRLINAPSGWQVQKTITQKMETYGLNDTFVNFSPGSDAAIVASLADAYKAGKAWVGYYWSPTAVTAKYDLTLLQEPPYDEETWKQTKGTAFPPNKVTIAVNREIPELAPEVTEFLSNYETSSKLTEDALNYMDKHEGASAEEAAEYWMKEHENVWTGWVPEDIAEKVKESLK